jgi:hypothetical protein
MAQPYLPRYYVRGSQLLQQVKIFFSVQLAKTFSRAVIGRKINALQNEIRAFRRAATAEDLLRAKGNEVEEKGKHG